MSSQRELFKDIELSGRRWRIKKFDPLTGSFVLMKVMNKVAHIVLGALGGTFTKEDQNMLAMSVSQSLGDFSKQDLAAIQTDCLRVCSELKFINDKEDAPLPVLMNDGRWGVSGLDDDIITVLALTGHALVFNMLPFFEEGALKQVVESFKSYSFPVDALTSTNLPSDQS